MLRTAVRFFNVPRKLAWQRQHCLQLIIAARLFQYGVLASSLLDYLWGGSTGDEYVSFEGTHLVSDEESTPPCTLSVLGGHTDPGPGTQTCLEAFVPVLEEVQNFLVAHNLDDPARV